MPLASGQLLGPYEILSPLGAGGMGEVYRARDTRLGRDVAIKILPHHLSADSSAKLRFEREAKTVSALNHPNICSLFDVGSQDGTDFLVMECIEGETLAQRIIKSALPTEQVLKLGTEIADALDKAHRSGVVHRDLKPGNIMLTKTGAKLLDFGLAKPATTPVSAVTVTNVAASTPVTERGTVVGTFQYMSPEQVEGKELDGRSDIFSLGAVLYEALTGQRAFEGKSQLSVASAILEKEPAPISTIKPLTPRALDHVIRRCLAKDPDDRWQSARDLALELKAISSLDPSSQSGAVLPVTAGKHFRELIAWAVAALALAAAAWLLALQHLKPPAVADSVSASILPPPEMELDQTAPVALSPDGKFVVFSVSDELWLRRLDSLEEKPLDGTEEAQNPFWSPDSRWIAFTAKGKLKKISVDGGSPLELCASGTNRGGSWGPDGTILFVSGHNDPVQSVSSRGGDPKPVTEVDKARQEITHRWPQFLPDGKHFLFFARGSENVVYVGSLDSRERKLILKNSTNALYAPPGLLLFQRNGSLMAQPFDAGRLELTGEPKSLVQGVATYSMWQHALFSVSDNGILAYQARADKSTQPVWADRSGKILESLSDPGVFTGGSISHDGQKIAFVIHDPQDDTTNMWSYDLKRHLKARLTFEPIVSHIPVWSPTGDRLFFATNRLGLSQVFSVSSSGVGQVERLYASEQSDYPRSWSPDGRYFAIDRMLGGDPAKFTIWIFENFGEEKVRPLLTNSHPPECCAVFSPDGKWIAYESKESGRTEVYIIPFPAADRKIPLSTGITTEPRWSENGKELFYRSGYDTIAVATLQYGKNGLQVVQTTPLFKTKSPIFDVSPDGQRILIFKDSENPKPQSITLLTNWPSLLSTK